MGRTICGAVETRHCTSANYYSILWYRLPLCQMEVQMLNQKWLACSRLSLRFSSTYLHRISGITSLPLRSMKYIADPLFHLSAPYVKSFKCSEPLPQSLNEGESRMFLQREGEEFHLCVLEGNQLHRYTTTTLYGGDRVMYGPRYACVGPCRQSYIEQIRYANVMRGFLTISHLMPQNKTHLFPSGRVPQY